LFTLLNATENDLVSASLLEGPTRPGHT